jgi:hypothetical protein
VTRHRLNRGGNRQANHALWRIVFTRMSSDPRTVPTSSGASPKGAPNPKSCESSSATSPARSTATSRRVTPRSERRVWPSKCPARHTAVLRTICRPAAPPLTPTPPGLIRACPRTRVAHHWFASNVANPAP